MDTVNPETGEITRPLPKGKGSFWVARQAIDILLANKATAMDICAYLVMAKHTDQSGQFSTSGLQAIYRAVGVGHAIAERAVQRLSQMQDQRAKRVGKGLLKNLVYPAAEWEKITGQEPPHGPTERSKVRWVLNDFGVGPEDHVWISNELVEGIGRFTQPLKRLKRCGDVAARLLLICYRESDLEQFGGVKPSGAFARSYEMYKIQTNIGHGYDIWHGVDKNITGWHAGINPALGVQKYSSEEAKRVEEVAPFWRAIEALDSAGFVYQVVSVMDREAGDPESQVIYELDTKSRHGYKPNGEHGLGGYTAKISHHLGNPVADSQGRLYGRYAVIVPAGIQPHVVGIYRLRFRVANPKNHGVKGAWSRIYSGQKEAREWLIDLASSENIELKMSDGGVG